MIIGFVVSSGTDLMFACLNYHDVSDREEQYSVSRTQFHQHLECLRAYGFQVNDFDDLHHRLECGSHFPDKYAVLTVDDGRQSTMTFADLLEEFGFKATFFVVRDRCLSRKGYLHPVEIRLLRARGFSFGTHGCSHQPLTSLSTTDLVAELHASRRWLEDSLGEAVRYMAAPGGFVSGRVLQTAYADGIALVATCKESMNSASDMCLPCTVSRVNIRRHFSLDDVARTATGNPSFYLHRQLRSALLWLPKALSARSA